MTDQLTLISNDTAHPHEKPDSARPGTGQPPSGKTRLDGLSSPAEPGTHQQREEICLVARQNSVLARRDEFGNLLLVQESWPDEESVILIHRDYEESFLDALCDLMGVPSVGRY